MAEHRPPGQHSGSQRDKKSYRQENDEAQSAAVTQATRPEGGAGGVSGTGQAFPHHGLTEAEAAQEAVENPVGEEAKLPMPETGQTYQAGGTHLNREHQAQTRKERLAGATVASEGRGGPDPAPGAPVDRG